MTNSKNRRIELIKTMNYLYHQNKIINKLTLTPEAIFDIRCCLNLPLLNRYKLKKEVEEYIHTKSAANLLPWWGYFKCDYLDEASGQQLKLFIKKGVKFGFMQCWDLIGVCLSSDWCEDAEEDGHIRTWLNTNVVFLPKEEDWVMRVRVWEVLKNTAKIVFEKF